MLLFYEFFLLLLSATNNQTKKQTSKSKIIRFSIHNPKMLQARTMRRKQFIKKLQQDTNSF